MVKIAIVLLAVALISCSSDPEYSTYENLPVSKILYAGDGAFDVRKSTEGWVGALDVVRVIDTELCVVFYLSKSGLTTPIPLAELAASTDTYLELADYCQGGFK